MSLQSKPAMSSTDDTIGARQLNQQTTTTKADHQRRNHHQRRKQTRMMTTERRKTCDTQALDDRRGAFTLKSQGRNWNDALADELVNDSFPFHEPGTEKQPSGDQQRVQMRRARREPTSSVFIRKSEVVSFLIPNLRLRTKSEVRQNKNSLVIHNNLTKSSRCQAPPPLILTCTKKNALLDSGVVQSAVSETDCFGKHRPGTQTHRRRKCQPLASKMKLLTGT